MTLAEPKPCPFCSGKSFAESPSLGRSHWNVVCDDCGASGPHGHDDQMAIRQWNIRAPVSNVPSNWREPTIEERPY